MARRSRGTGAVGSDGHDAAAASRDREARSLADGPSSGLDAGEDATGGLGAVPFGRPGRDAYVELADEAAYGAAVRSRTEARERRERASELATWRGTMRDLAEQRAVVVAWTAAGRRHHGTLIAAAVDHVALELSSGARVLIRLDALRQVTPQPGRTASPPSGDRDGAQDRVLIEVLERCFEERCAVVVCARDVREPVRGRVVGLGEDVVTLAVEGRSATTLLPVDAIVEVVLPP